MLMVRQLPVEFFRQEEDVFLHPAQADFTAHLSGHGVTTPSVLSPPPWLYFNRCPVCLHQPWFTGTHLDFFLLGGFFHLCFTKVRGRFQIILRCANSDPKWSSCCCCTGSNLLFKTPLLLIHCGQTMRLICVVLFGLCWPLGSQGIRFKCLCLVLAVRVGRLCLQIWCEGEKGGLWGKHAAIEFVLICLHILQVDVLLSESWAAYYRQWWVGRITAHPGVKLHDWFCAEVDTPHS